jgi:hypothetical protein
MPDDREDGFTKALSIPKPRLSFIRRFKLLFISYLCVLFINHRRSPLTLQCVKFSVTTIGRTDSKDSKSITCYQI